MVQTNYRSRSPSITEMVNLQTKHPCSSFSIYVTICIRQISASLLPYAYMQYLYQTNIYQFTALRIYAISIWDKYPQVYCLMLLLSTCLLPDPADIW